MSPLKSAAGTSANDGLEKQATIYSGPILRRQAYVTMHSDYQKHREEVGSYFNQNNLIVDSTENINSPSNKYVLTIEEYTTKEGAWTYTRGLVKEISTGAIIADVKRNYSHFWYSWCLHENGNEYLLCGEDYQGQTVVNLTMNKVVNHFPSEGLKGTGFCWVDAYPSPDTKIIAVEGCIWACPYEIISYDFSEPDILPYRELGRVDNLEKASGWKDNKTFSLTCEVEVRKNDGVPYSLLSEEEQDALDDGIVASEYVIESKDINMANLSEKA